MSGWRRVWYDNRRLVQLSGATGFVLALEYFYGDTGVTIGMMRAFEGRNALSIAGQRAPAWLRDDAEGIGVAFSDSGDIRGAVEAISPPRAALYVEGQTPFVTTLAEAVGYRKATLDVFGTIRWLFSLQSKEEGDFFSWPALRSRLERSARRYMSKNQRGVVLVIGQADAVAQAEEPLFRDLITFAKDGSDEGTFRIVFVVARNGPALQQLQASPFWNRVTVYQ